MNKLLIKRVNVNNYYEEEPFFILDNVNGENFDFVYIIEECCQLYKDIYGKDYFFEVEAIEEKKAREIYPQLPSGQPENLLSHYIKIHFTNYANLIKNDIDSLNIAKKIIKENKKIKRI